MTLKSKYDNYDSYDETLSTNIIFDSYMDDDLSQTSLFRLLKVDNDVYLPAHSHLRVLVTSADVIHS